MKHLALSVTLLLAIVVGFFVVQTTVAVYYMPLRLLTKWLVVMDDQSWKEGLAGRALFDVLNSPVLGLPQTEPNFRIMQIAPENFTTTFRTMRNIVIP